MKKKVVSLALASVMVLGSVSMAAAAPYDLVHKTNDPAKNYSFLQFMNSNTVFNKVSGDLGNYLLTAKDGKLYSAVEVDAKINKNPGMQFDEAVVGLTPVEIDKPVEGELKVVEVSAINARQIKVVFNQPVNLNSNFVTNGHSARNLKNYYIGLTEDVSTTSIADLSTNWEVVAGSDYDKDTKTGKEVILQSKVAAQTIFDATHELGIQKGRMFTLEIRNVESKDGKGMNTQAFTLKSEDTIAPKVVLGQTKVLEGATTVKFKFSEPVMADASTAQLAAGAEVYLNGDKLNVTAIAITDKAGTVAEASEITVTVPALKKGQNTFSFVGAKDLAGNFLSPNPTVITVDVVKDATTAEVPQVLEIKQVDDNAVVFVTNVAIDTAIGTIDVEKVDGTNDISIDLSSLTASHTFTDVTATVLADEPASSTKAAYKLTFTNATNGVGANELSYNGANTILRKFEINGLANNADNSKVMTNEYVKTVTFKKDIIAPTVLEVDHTANGFTIEFVDAPFNKDVKDGSGSIVVKYVKDGVTYSETLTQGTGAGTYTTLASNVMTLVLTTNKGLDANGKLVAGATYTIELPDGIVNDGVKDDPGAELDPARPHDFVGETLTYKVPGSSTDYLVPQVSQVDVTSPTDNKNIIDIVIHGDNIDPATVTNKANYRFNGEALPQGTVIEFYADTNGDGNATTNDNNIIIKLPENAVEFAGNYPLEIKNIATKDGYKMLDTTVTVAAWDNYAPSIVEATITGSKTILVEFSETMTQLISPADAQAVNNFTVTVDGVKYAVASITDSAADRVVEITTDTDFDVDAKIVVKVSEDQNGNMVLKDAQGNKAKTSSVTAVKQQ